jgi:hypothetical protein
MGRRELAREQSSPDACPSSTREIDNEKMLSACDRRHRFCLGRAVSARAVRGRHVQKQMHDVSRFNSPELVKASDADLIAATLNGKGKMPAYAGKLTPAQVKEVIAYIRTLQK